MHTVAQARMLWCPHVRAPVAVATYVNGASQSTWVAANADMSGIRGLSSNPQTSCIASGCAAWRWAGPPLRKPDQDQRTGYCGLCGVPKEPA